MKLTEAQRRELAFLLRARGACYFNDRYGPIKRLLAEGFVSRVDARYGGGMYSITPAGRAELEQSGEK